MKPLAIALLLISCVVLAGPASAIRQFVVFFDGANPEQLDPVQWQITAEADAVISEFASAFKQLSDPAAAIRLTASDQHVGTLEMSIERSRRRGEAVKARLIAKGVPAHAVLIHACGFRRLMVLTPPGTAEPLNRFVALDRAVPEDTSDPCAS